MSTNAGKEALPEKFPLGPKGGAGVLRVAKNAGAKRILLPMSSIADPQNVAPELIGAVSPEFYETGDAVAAARRALGL